MRSLTDVATFATTHYDIGVTHVAQLTDKVYKLATSNHEYLLKFTDGDDDFLMKQLYAHKELPHVALPIYETREGLRRAVFEGGFAYLTDYIPQTPMPFESRVRDYGKILGELHEKTAVTVDKNEDEVSWMYDADFRKLEENFTILEGFMTGFEMKLSRSPFEWQLLMMYPLIEGMYRRSDESLKRFYRVLSRKKQLPVAMNHGDVNVSNLLPTAKDIHLVNFENSYFDVPTGDMLQFLSHYHQSKGTARIITDYLNNVKEPILVHHFFMNALCLDLVTLKKHLSGNALIDISLLNEKLAPCLIAMGIYDELNAPKQPSKKSSPKKEKTVEKTE